MKKIDIIVLAAGESSRMGRSKQLLPVQGKPLLAYILEVVTSINGARVTVVLGAKLEDHLQITKQFTEVTTVVNKEWRQGIGSSIKAGLNFCLRLNKSLEAVLLMVCDQPFINASHLNNLISTYDNKSPSVVTSAYGAAEGTPAIFDKTVFSDLLSLKDDEGAKRVIKSLGSDKKISIDFPEGELDLDTPTDYERYLSRTVTSKKTEKPSSDGSSQ